MNTFWLKIAALAVVVVGLIIIVNKFTGSKSEPKPESKTFHDVVEEDKQRFLTEPQAAKEQLSQPVQPSEKPTILYFRPLSEIEKMEAERLLNVAVPGRSIGRLPMTGFHLMVESCRRIISKWPDSWYAYRAKQLLADMPTRFRPRYKITQEELDVSKFSKPRPGTEPFTIEDSR
jgi:hypothetical protein